MPIFKLYNPFLIIDGVGYKTKYEPCQALNSYANELLNSGTANVILEEPPALGLVSDNTYVSALLGAYSWQKKDVDQSLKLNHPATVEDKGFGEVVPEQMDRAF